MLILHIVDGGSGHCIVVMEVVESFVAAAKQNNGITKSKSRLVHITKTF